MLAFYAAMIDDEGERLRFTDIYNNYCKQMLVAERILKNREDAEDAVQIALLGIAKRIKSLPFGNPNRLRAYVLTAAKNAAISILFKKQPTDATNIPSIAADEDLFQQVVLSQDYVLLLRAMRQMHSPYREVLLMLYVQEQSVKDTAVLLHRRESTVSQQRNRGKKLLVELCRKEGLRFENNSL